MPLPIILSDKQRIGYLTRLFHHVSISHNVYRDFPCFEWTGVLSDGYGMIGFLGRMCGVHRVTMACIYGRIPEGLEIDHLCRNRACFHPDHLEVVTCAENRRRIPRLPQTRCLRGHLYEFSASGKRITCRPCRAYREAAGRERDRQKKKAFNLKRQKEYQRIRKKMRREMYKLCTPFPIIMTMAQTGIQK